MNVGANIFAVLLLTVVPYLRPCACLDFTLWCLCSTAAEEHAEQHHDCDCEGGHGHSHTHRHGDKKPDRKDAPDHQKHQPCNSVSALESPAALTATPVAGDQPQPIALAGLLPVVPGLVREVEPKLAFGSRAPPVPISLIVVRTRFLRI